MKYKLTWSNSKGDEIEKSKFYKYFWEAVEGSKILFEYGYKYFEIEEFEDKE